MENNDLLLQSVISATPYPLEAEKNGSVTIHIKKPSKTIYCNKIGFSFVVGSGSTALFESISSKSTDSPYWIDITQKKNKIDDLDEEIYLTFSCKEASKELIDYPFSFTISGKVTNSAAPYDIEIYEMSKTSAGDEYEQHSGLFTEIRIKPKFYLENFYAVSYDSPTIVQTEFDRGAALRLSWDSNGSDYQLSTGNPPRIVYEGSESTYLISEGIDKDTVFLLDAIQTDNRVLGEAFPKGALSEQHLYSYLPLTVTEPDITVHDITAKGKLLAKDSVSLFGSSAQILKAGSLEAPEIYSADTDGLILIMISIMSEGEMTVKATCENKDLTLYAKYPDTAFQNGFLPVFAGESFEIGHETNSKDYEARFQWVSIGRRLL